MRSLRRIAPILVLGIAALLRLWALNRPETLVFDELYYVRDAISQLTYGFPTLWPDDEPGMSGARATAFTDDASNAVHPPLGKWLIGLGILLFGPDSGWGWRAAVALAGIGTVAVTMRLAWRMSRSLTIACLAGLLLAIDGVHVVLSRVALLDGLLTFAIALGALLVWRDQEQQRAREERRRHEGRPLAVSWWRPWLVAAGLVFGAGAAIKWSGLYPLAFFLVFVTARDLVARLRPGCARSRTAATARAAGQAAAAALLALPAAAVAYLASWTGWIVRSGGWDREPGVPWPLALARYHAEMWAWHSTLDAPHPYAAHPVTWPLALRPTGMRETRWTEGCPWESCVSAISPLPNALVTLGGVVALLLLTVIVIRRAHRRLVTVSSDPLSLAVLFLATGYLSGWLPWMLTVSRSAVFQFYSVVLTPFSAVALALLLGLLCRIPIRSASVVSRGLPLDPSPSAVRGRRIAVALYLGFACALAAFFFPVWSGMPVSDWFWRLHLWLPGWA